MTAPTPPSPEWPHMSEHFSNPEDISDTDGVIQAPNPELINISKQLSDALDVFGYDFIDNVCDVGQIGSGTFGEKELEAMTKITRLKEEFRQIPIVGPVAVRTIHRTNSLEFIDNPAAVGALRIIKIDYLESELSEKKTAVSALHRSFGRSFVIPAKVLEPLEKLKNTYFSDSTPVGIMVPRDCGPLNRLWAPLLREERDIFIAAGLNGFIRQPGEFSEFLRYDSHVFLEILRSSQSPSDTWKHVLKPYLQENAVIIDELRHCNNDGYETLTEQVKTGLLNLAQSLIEQRDYR